MFTFFKQGELEILKPFYLAEFLAYILHFAPVFYVVYLSQLGFSLFHISLLLAIIPLISLIFEIPTGTFADLYGRKFSVLFGYSLEGLAFLLMFFVNDFLGILAIFAFLGFAQTFSSGAKEAWITDLIKHNKRNLLHEFFAKNNSLNSLGIIIAGIIGTYLVQLYGIKIIWLAGAASFLISIIILLFAKEYFVKNIRTKKFGDLKKQVSVSIGYSYKHSIISYFLLANGIFLFAAGFNVMLSWTPLLQGLGFPDFAFGYVLSLLAVVGVIAPLVCKKFMKKNKERRFIVTSTIFTVLFSILVIFAQNMFIAFFLMILISFSDSVQEPAKRVFFHRFVPSKIRATVGSIENMIISIIAIISLPVAGFVLDLIGPQYTVFISGLLMIPSIFVFYKINDSYKMRM